MAATTASDATAFPMVPVPCRVLASARETEDTVTLRVEAPPGYRFAAGQFNMLYAFGAGEVAISVSGDPTVAGPVVHTIRDVGAVTAALSRLAPGEMVGVRGPYGNPWPVDTPCEDLLVIAGGLGLAPLRPALYHALAHRERYRRVVLLYGARTPDGLLYRAELAELSQVPGLRVELTVDAAAPGWQGAVGVVPALLARVDFDPGAALAMVCGPEVMMRFTVTALLDRGLTPDRVHLSMERNMHCAIGFCGHCQLGPAFICRDGPVLPYTALVPWMTTREM